MTVPLYIFEERYKRMVKDLVDANERRFVIALAKRHAAISDGTVSICEVGSFVDIVSVTENTDGTYNIVVHGQERCKVAVSKEVKIKSPDGSSSPLHYTQDEPYPLIRGDLNLERVAAWDALDLFRQYAKSFFAFDASKQIEEALPSDLLHQASFICANIRVPIQSRQVLLEAPSLADRFLLASKLMKERLEAHRSK